MADERRRHKRKEVDLTASYQIEGGERIPAHLKDMSLGGAFLETSQPAPFGAKIKLFVDVDGREMAVDAIVRWRSKNGMGVQFGLLGAKDTYQVTEFLARRTTLPDIRD